MLKNPFKNLFKKTLLKNRVSEYSYIYYYSLDDNLKLLMNISNKCVNNFNSYYTRYFKSYRNQYRSDEYIIDIHKSIKYNKCYTFIIFKPSYKDDYSFDSKNVIVEWYWDISKRVPIYHSFKIYKKDYFNFKMFDNFLNEV